MVQRVPRDMLCHARILQRVKMNMGQVTYHPSSNFTVEHPVSCEFHAYWIDYVGVYYFQWEWSSMPEEVSKPLNEYQALKKYAEAVDNHSEAGRKAVFMIESFLPKVDQIAKEVLIPPYFTYVTSHQWNELVRNAVR